MDSSILANRSVRHRLEVGQRHELRDRKFVRDLMRYFSPGAVLELGASTGHISAILQQYGRDVTASDTAPKVIPVIESRGLKAALVDATHDIVRQTGQAYANIYAQNVLPLIQRDRTQVVTTLRCIHGALEPVGRFICVGAHPWRQRDPDAFFSPREQIEIAKSTGLFRLITWFPHQIVPPGWYRQWNASFLNLLDHKLAFIASTRLVWVLEKIER